MVSIEKPTLLDVKGSRSFCFLTKYTYTVFAVNVVFLLVNFVSLLSKKVYYKEKVSNLKKMFMPHFCLLLQWWLSIIWIT